MAPASPLTADEIHGVYTPVVTPFRDDETVDDAAYEAALERQLAAGVAGIVVGGTTGEYYAMTIDERRDQLGVAASIVGDRAQLVAGCNTGATRDVITLARHARDLGYRAVMLSAPPISLPSQSQLAAAHRARGRRGWTPDHPRTTTRHARGRVRPRLPRPDRRPLRRHRDQGVEWRLLAVPRPPAPIRRADRDDVRHRRPGVRLSGVGRAELAGRTANVFPAEHVRFVETMASGDHRLGRDCSRRSCRSPSTWRRATTTPRSKPVWRTSASTPARFAAP